MKKTAAAALISVIMLMFTACQAVQVNERMFVQMMGIEENEEGCILTVQVYDTSSESSSPEYLVFSGTGRSIREAANVISREKGRELFFGHCSVIFANESILCDPDKLKTLAGERISVGCPVIYSHFPENTVKAEDSEGNLIGAEEVKGRIEQYRSEGLAEESTLKSVTAAAENSTPAVILMYGESPEGTAVINSQGEISFLDMTETAAFNLLRGCRGINLSVLGGSITAGKTEKSVYYHKTGDGAGEYQLNISLECTLNEIGITGDISLYRENIREIISRSAEAICQRGLEEDFLETITGENLHNNGDSVVFSADTTVTLRA